MIGRRRAARLPEIREHAKADFAAAIKEVKTNLKGRWPTSSRSTR